MNRLAFSVDILLYLIPVPGLGGEFFDSCLKTVWLCSPVPK